MKQHGAFPKTGVTVEIHAGTYELRHPLDLTAEDSGTTTAPISYRAQPGAAVRIAGGKEVHGWKPVTDPGVLARLDPDARGHVLQAGLRAQGITDLAGIQSPGQWAQSSPGLEFFFQDRPMTLARWPNHGFVRMVKVLGPTPVDVRGTKGSQEGIFQYEGDRPSRWINEPEIWLHGYWFWDWADERERVQSIDTTRHVITLAKPYHSYGYREGQWYYAENILSELDEPGEWYLDRQSGILYFWPPAPIKAGHPTVSILPSLLNLNGVSHLTLRGLTLEACRGTAVTVDGGDAVSLIGCTVRNTGSWGVRIANAKNSGVKACDIYFTGDGGVALDGGDRKTLTAANLYADDNHIHHFAHWNPVYKPGIDVSGVGNRITHNLIDNGPHMAIGFSGNNHLMEYNEIHSVCYQSNDAGAIYAGRNWTMRGTIIRYNYFHDISGFEGRGCVGVYLDDQYCGTQIYGNLFHRVTRAAMIGGGRDNTIENNIFVDCVPSVHLDARGLGWAASGFDGLKQSLQEMPYQQPPWSTEYPKLVDILNNDPMAPTGNLIARNICVGGRWGDLEAKAVPYSTITANLIGQDPHFVDGSHSNFRLRPDSTALKLGFKRIPFEEIGLYRSADRASWPVKSVVRPVETSDQIH